MIGGSPGVPALIVTTWAVCIHFRRELFPLEVHDKVKDKCWDGSGSLDIVNWMIVGPVLAALTVRLRVSLLVLLCVCLLQNTRSLRLFEDRCVARCRQVLTLSLTNS